MENIIENFEQVWNDSRSKILNLDIEFLTKILSSEKLKNGSQQTVWQVIHDWVIANKKDRLTHLPNLLKKNLQFDRLTTHFVEENIFKNVIFMLLPLSFQTDLKNFVKNVNFQDKLKNDSFNLPNLSPVIKYGHQKLLCISRKDGYLEIYDQQHNSWHSLTLSLQPVAKQRFFELALLGSMLYAFGGIDDDDNALNHMWSRDLSDPSSQWTARANMKQSRKGFASVVLNDSIYALGGEDENCHRLRSCERYCSQLNEWSTVANMNRERYYASAAVINGCIYVAGGWGEQLKVFKSVSKYCPETDTWSEVAPMTTGRSQFALTPFAGRLWAIGGEGDYLQSLSSCESYDPVTDTWREEAPMKEERWEHAAIEFNGELYVGGRFHYYEAIVEKYVPGEGWTVSVGQLKNKNFTPKLLLLPNVLAEYYSAYNTSNSKYKQKTLKNKIKKYFLYLLYYFTLVS